MLLLKLRLITSFVLIVVRFFFPGGMDVMTYHNLKSPGFKRTQTSPLGTRRRSGNAGLDTDRSSPTELLDSGPATDRTGPPEFEPEDPVTQRIQIPAQVPVHEARPSQLLSQPPERRWMEKDPAEEAAEAYLSRLDRKLDIWFFLEYFSRLKARFVAFLSRFKRKNEFEEELVSESSFWVRKPKELEEELPVAETPAPGTAEIWDQLEAEEQSKSLWIKFKELCAGVEKVSYPARFPDEEPEEEPARSLPPLETLLAQEEPAKTEESAVPILEDAFLVNVERNPVEQHLLWWAIPFLGALLFALYWVCFHFAKALMN